MKIVYLDQNHWIYLARAYFMKSSENRETLDLAVSAVSAGRARFPISAVNSMELHKVKNLERRRRLAEFFIFLSEGWFLAPWNAVLETECENAVIAEYRLAKDKVDVDPVGRGIIFALGAYYQAEKDLGWSYEFARRFEAEQDTPEALVDFLACPDESAAGELGRSLRSLDKRYSAQVAELRHKRRELVPNELRDYSAGNVFLSIYAHLLGAHLRAGIEEKELLEGGRQRMLKWISEIPSAYVDSTLCYQRDKQWTRDVSPNDLADLGHLNIAIPYCDVIVTERFWADIVSRTDLEARFDTRVSPTLDVLSEVLKSV